MGGRFGVRAGVGPVVALTLAALASAPLADTATVVSDPATVIADPATIIAKPGSAPEAATDVADPGAASEAATDVPDAAADVAQAPAAATPGVTLRTAVYEVEQLLDRDGRVERRLVPALDLVAGDELRYVVTVHNETGRRVEPGRIEVRVAVPADTRLLPGSAGGAGALVEYALGAGAFSPHLPMAAEPSEPTPATVAPSGPAPAAEPVAETAAAPAAAAALAAGAAAPSPDSGAGTTDGAAEQQPGEAGGVAHTPASGELQSAAAVAGARPPPDEPPADAGPVSIRWTYQQPLEAAGSAELFFHVRLE